MKRSSKKYRNPEKKARKNRSKKMLATGMMICLGTLPVWCDDEVLLTIFPSAGKALGSYADVQADFGVGAKLTWRRNENLDLFVEGDYKNLTLPNVSSATLINGGVGAGYHLPINDRWGVNLSAQVGGYRASKSEGVLTGLSGGISVSMTYRINPTISVEAGAAANHFVAKPEPLLTDVGATAGLTVNLTRAFTDTTKIKMETREIQPVFPVLYSWYKNNSFASVGITNEEDTAIDNVKVSFYQPQYMSQPNLCATIEKLGKGETFDAELTAFFNERMLDLTEKTNTEASVIIEYSYLGQKRKKTIAMVVPVYGRNSMSWDDDRRASVFVSSKDPAALMFSKYISSIVRDNVRMGISHNIQYAMGIFETLDQFGINYVIDPSSAYSDNVGSTSIDFLQFPYQTLTYRGGDCDDLSILTCSLFEAVGIKTAFITIPGHIFIAFDSGLSMKEAEQSLMNTSNLIDRNGQAWVPLEITLTDEGFSRAWRTGAREWNQANANGTAAFYAMEDSWKIYDPVSVPGANANFTMPEKEVVSRLFQHSMDQWIAREISPVVAKYNALLARHDSDEIRNELGILYGQYGLFVEADDQFKRARRRGYLPSLLNTANVYFARQQYTIALEWYKKVLDEDPRNELAILGIARCNYELENYDECDAAFDVVRNMNPSLAAEYTYLGAFEQTVGRSFSLADRIALTKWDRGNYFSGVVNDSDGSNADGMFDNEDANGFVIAETNPTDSEKGSGGEADSLLAQLTNMNDPDAILKPDAVIKDEKKEAVLPKNKYAEMDDIENLVEELPGLLAQLKIPEANLDSPKPVTVGYEMVAQTPAAETPVIEERRTIPVKEAEPARDLSSLINKSKLEPKSQPAETTTQTTPAVAAVQPTTAQPEATQTPAAIATATPTVTQPATVQPTTVQTPAATVTVAPTVTQPTIVQTPATVTPAVAVTQPTIVETPVEVIQAGTVTPTTVVETPVTVAQTGTVVQPTIAQPTAIETPAATVTTTPTVVQPTVVTTQPTPAVAVTQPTTVQPTAIETPAATVTTTPTVDQPTQVTTQPSPAVAVTQPVTVQPTAIETPAATVTVAPTVTQPAETTVTPTVVQPTQVTTQPSPAVAVTQPVTVQPTTVQTPAATVTVAPTVTKPAETTVTPTVVQPTVVTTQTTPAVAVTQPAPAQPTAIETPTATVTTAPTVAQPTQVTTQTTPAVAVTQPATAQPTTIETPAATVTTTPTVAQPTVVTTQTTPAVAVTQPAPAQPTTVQTPAATVTTTPTVAQPTVVRTPTTVTPAVAVTQPTIVETPVAVTQAGTVTPTTVMETPVTVAQTGTVVQPTIVETPVTVSQAGTVVQPTIVETPVTVSQAGTVAQPTVVVTPATVSQAGTVTQPAVAQTPASVTPAPQLDEWEMDEEEAFFASLLAQKEEDEVAETPVASNAPVIGPVLQPAQKEEEDIFSREIAYLNEIPTAERAAPRFTESPTSGWVPEEVYTAKIIPGMKTFEEEMSGGDDKSYLYNDNLGLLSDDTAEAIAMEKEAERRAEQEKKDAQYALENWDKIAYNNKDDSVLFSYLSDETLEEIQHVSIVDKIREQSVKSVEEKAEQSKKKGLLAKSEDARKKLAAGTAEEAPVEEKVEPVAQVQENTETKVEENAPVQEGSAKKNVVWPYVAGGTGLLGLFVIILIVFWKRDDDDDDEEDKDSLEKKGVTV